MGCFSFVLAEKSRSAIARREGLIARLLPKPLQRHYLRLGGGALNQKFKAVAGKEPAISRTLRRNNALEAMTTN